MWQKGDGIFQKKKLPYRGTNIFPPAEKGTSSSNVPLVWGYVFFQKVFIV